MGLKFSEMCRRASVNDAVIRDIISKGRDFDLDHIARKYRQAETELREQLVERAYAKSAVSTPIVPNFSLAYDARMLIADLVSPIMPGSVERKYAKWARRNTTRINNVLIGADGAIPEAGIDVTFPTYTEKGYGEQQQVDLNAIAQSSASLDLFEAHTASLMGDLLLAREKRVADKVMTSANYATGCTTALSSTNRWDVGPATSTADPVRDIRVTMKQAAGVGVIGNTLIGSSKVLEYLRTHPSVIAQAGVTADTRVVSDDMLKKMFGLEHIFEGAARYDTAGNTATASYSQIWGTGCVLAHVRPGVGLMQQAFMKTFRHTDLSFRDELDNRRGVRGVSWLIGTHEDADEIVMSDGAYLLDTVIS